MERSLIQVPYSSLECLSGSGYIGKAAVWPGSAFRVPTGCLNLVPSMCSIFGPITFCFLEALPFREGRLPGNLLIFTALLPVTQGTVSIPVFNMGTEDQWLHPRTILGSLHVVDPTSGPSTDDDKNHVCPNSRSQYQSPHRFFVLTMAKLFPIRAA